MGGVENGLEGIVRGQTFSSKKKKIGSYRGSWSPPEGIQPGRYVSVCERGG